MLCSDNYEAITLDLHRAVGRGLLEESGAILHVAPEDQANCENCRFYKVRISLV